MKRRHFRLMAEETGGEGAGGGTGGDGAQATPPATPPAATPADSQNSTSPWTQSVADEDLRKYAEGKQFKDAGEAVKALRDLESKHVAPATVDEYQLPVPQGQDGTFAKQAATWMHKAGIPVEAGRQLAAQWNDFQTGQMQQAQVARQQKAEQEIGALKTEWGDQYDTNVELGRRAMSTFGIPSEVIDALAGKMGDAKTLKVFQAIGKSMSESTLNPGGASSNTPAANTEAARVARMFPSMAKQ